MHKEAPFLELIQTSSNLLITKCFQRTAGIWNEYNVVRQLCLNRKRIIVGIKSEAIKNFMFSPPTPPFLRPGPLLRGDARRPRTPVSGPWPGVPWGLLVMTPPPGLTGALRGFVSLGLGSSPHPRDLMCFGFYSPGCRAPPRSSLPRRSFPGSPHLEGFGPSPGLTACLWAHPCRTPAVPPAGEGHVSLGGL